MGDRDRGDRGDRMDRKRMPVITEDTIINYKEVETLQKFMTSQGKILPRRRLGCDAKTQHRIRAAIQRARFVGLLPHGA